MQDSQINAQDTIPQIPPDARTAKGLELDFSLPNVVMSCLALSYVAKYRPVPMLSLTVHNGSG